MKTLTLSVLAAIPALFACQSSGAHTDASIEPASAQEGEPLQLPGASPEAAMEEMMARYMQLAQPGEHHAKLEPFIGEFTFEASMRMGPDTPWSTSAGTMTTRWILGGRYQLSEYDSTSEEMGPFSGMGILGFDNANERYMSVWLDTWGTWIPPAAKGTMKGNVLTMENSFENPVTGRTEKYRDVTTIVDANHYTFEMYAPGPDGELFRNLEIKYTRK